MDKYETNLSRAIGLFRAADHLAYVTYPLVKDNKLLWSIAKNLYLCGIYSVDAVLNYERLYKRISVLPTDVDSKIYLFESSVAQKFGIKNEVSRTIKDLKNLTKEHKESTVEFSRRGRLVICNEDYSMVKTIDINMIKSYIVVMRNFLHFVNGLGKNV